jgi:hypothetical protein
MEEFAFLFCVPFFLCITSPVYGLYQAYRISILFFHRFAMVSALIPAKSNGMGMSADN